MVRELSGEGNCRANKNSGTLRGERFARTLRIKSELEAVSARLIVQRRPDLGGTSIAQKVLESF
jgi:hypothetical protein